MPAPIRTAWHNRPGWSEYKAPRVGGNLHWGYDSYCLPRTTIYAIGDGEVVAKGYAASGFGHYIDVFYPGLGIREREAHMAEESGLRRGALVTASSALGRVGNTGNAKNILWMRNGVELRHVHSQAWLGNTTAGSKNVDPRGFWGGTAGDDPIPIPAEPEYQGDNDMLMMHKSTPGKGNGLTYVVFGPGFWMPFTTTDNNISGGFANQVGKGDSVGPVSEDFWAYAEGVSNAGLSIDYDKLAAALAPLVGSGGGSFTETDRARLEAVPTAEQNADATRNRIVAKE